MRRWLLQTACVLAAVLWAVVPVRAADETAEPPPRLLYHPSICGETIAFSCFGDIWIVRGDGSALKRITDDPGRDVYPVLSPDGTMIAFASNRTGPWNVFVIPTGGGEARQLSWSRFGERPVTWTRDGAKIVFRGPANDSWDPWLYTVPVEGGMRKPLPLGEAFMGTYSLDGRFFAFNRKGLRAPWRKGYRGSADSDVWVADLEKGTFEKRTDFPGPDSWPLFGPKGDLFFVSERDGVKNLYRLERGETTPRRLTDHAQPGVVYPSISPDGKTIVYQHGFAIWMISTRGGAPRQVPIEVVGEPKQDLTKWVKYDARADEFAVHPDGTRVTVSCRGDLFEVATDKKSDKTRITTDPGRDHVPVYSLDGKKLAFISDRSGEEQVYVYDRESRELTEIVPPESLLAVQMCTWLNNRLAFRPDGKVLAFHAGQGLYVYDLASAKTTKVTEAAERSVLRSAWSPDGKWLAYSKFDRELEPHLYVYSFDTGEERQLYDDPFGEWRPVWSPDGKYLLFVARHEVGEEREDLGRGLPSVMSEVYALALQKETVDPDDPADAPQENDEEEADAEEDDGAEDDADETKDEVTVEIDFDNVEQRTRCITRMVEDIKSPLLVTADSKRVIFGLKEPRGNREVTVLYSAPIERRSDPDAELKEIAQLPFEHVRLADDGKTLFVLDGGKVKTVPVGGGKVETVEFSLEFPVDLRDEMRQIYFEAWRAMREGFYDESMHGADWAAARDKYAPFLGSVVDSQEVMDLVSEMIGELNASHCGAYPSWDNTWGTFEDSRQLGLELEPDAESGFYRVSHIYEDGPADESWLDLAVGDSVFEIEGHAVRVGDNYEPLLVNPLNPKVRLSVGREPDPDAAHQVRIRHIIAYDQRRLWYEERVRENGRIVDEKTGGRVGYLHIWGMDSRSLAKFRKDVQAMRQRDGLIIDVRRNGGGSTDSHLIDILNRRVYHLTQYRDASKRRRPYEAFYGVKAMLIDSGSSSNAEMFPDGFRTLGHGKLIGEPTGGGVIGTGSFRFVDGSSIRMPTFGIWRLDGTGLENYGVPPDILVEKRPEDDLNGTDRQLDAAIEHVMSEIEAASK